MWSCFCCGRRVRSNPIVCDLCGGAAPDAEGALVALARRRDLLAEADLHALGFWARAGGLVAIGAVVARVHQTTALGLGLRGAAALAVVLLGHFLDRLRDEARLAAGLGAVAGLGLTTLAMVRAILDYDRVGPALPAALAFAGGSRAWPLVGLVAALSAWAAALWMLFSPRSVAVCRPRYQRLIARTPMLRAPTLRSPFFTWPLLVAVLWSFSWAELLWRSG